jgi:hypothetical protein
MNHDQIGSVRFGCDGGSCNGITITTNIAINLNIAIVVPLKPFPKTNTLHSNLEPRTSNLEPRTSNLEPRTSNPTFEPRQGRLGSQETDWGS